MTVAVALKVLVLGGRGFIGRHAVAALRRLDVKVVVGSRDRPDEQQAAEQMLQVALHEKTEVNHWRALADEFDVVLNCVGILRPAGGGSYDAVHHLAPAALAHACRSVGTRFIHVSALGLSPDDRSGFLTSKRRGELAVQNTGGDWILVRPSLLDGVGGFGAAWLRGVARLPVFVVPADARGKIAALMVEDLAEALAALCVRTTQSLGLERSRVFELGGPHACTFVDYIRGLRRRHSRSRALAIPIPGLLARLFAHFCDVVHFTPFSFGHWELLRKDNMPQPNRLGELLGRPPAAVIELE